MSAQSTQRSPENERILNWLRTEFYDSQTTKESSAASSHWAEFSKKIAVDGSDGGEKTLHGYGFGDLEQNGLAKKLFSATATSLHRLSHANLPLAGEIILCKSLVRRMGLSYSQDAFRQACTLHLLKQHVRSDCEEVLIIGDGYGLLAGLIHETFPKARVTLIDLGAVLYFQAFGLTKVWPAERCALVSSKTVLGDEAGSRLRFVPAESLAETELSFSKLDVAVNIASMQEMDPDMVASYFHLLRKNKAALFYCCNRLEKKLPDGKVSAYHSYPWLPGDQHLVDEPCPWQQWFLGLPPFGKNNLTLRGLPLPLIHRYDGTHWHRLTRMAHEK